MNSTTISSAIYIWGFLFFCVDSSLFFLCEQQPIYLLLAYSITILFLRPTGPMLSFLLLLACLQSFLYYTLFGLPLVYLLPAIMLTRRFAHMLYMSMLYPLILALGCLMIQVYALELTYLGLESPLFYTISKIFGTLILVGIFSLKNMGHRKTTAYS